jgi:hypothetical protein
MSSDPNKHQNELAAKLAANEKESGMLRRVVNVKTELEVLTDVERKRVLQDALRELKSSLIVR